MNIPESLVYTESHEYVQIKDDIATIGITTFATDMLGDIVFLSLPQVGETFQREDPFGTVESVKAVEELYAPLSGMVVAVNEALVDSPELLNDDPYNAWIIKLRFDQVSEVDDLLSAETYRSLLT